MASSHGAVFGGADGSVKKCRPAGRHFLSTEINSAFAELRSVAGGLQAVLLLPLALQTLDMTAFSASLV